MGMSPSEKSLPPDRHDGGKYPCWLGYAVLLWVIFTPTPSLCQDDPSIPAAQIPSLLSAVRNVHHLTFCDKSVPLDNQQIRERFEKEFLLILWNRPQVILWIKRSARYFPLIEKMLKEADLPDDLKFVAVVESALRPHIRSSKGAVGYWQFIKPTGLKYGLRIDRDIDERRNLLAATRAAIAYFKDLYDIFGTWALFDDEPRVLAAEAIEDSRLLRIDRGEFNDLLSDDVRIAQGIIRTVARKLRELAERAV